MIVLTLTPILTKPLEQGANFNFEYKLTTAVFWDDFGGYHPNAVSKQYHQIRYLLSLNQFLLSNHYLSIYND